MDKFKKATLLLIIGGIIRLSFYYLEGSAFAATSSTSYKMSTQVIEAGGASANSTSYKLLGKARERAIDKPASTSYTLGEGFIRSAYFAPPAFAPIVTSITPSTGVNTDPINITDLSGANFVAGATVKLSRTGQADIIATNVFVKSGSKITCTLDITGAAIGFWDVVVTNPDGRSGTLPSAFKVTQAAPLVTSIDPNKGINNATVDAVVTGNYFRSGATIKLTMPGEADIIGEAVVVQSSTKLSVRFNLVDKAVGMWDVVVANDDGQTATLAQGFKIEAPNITVTVPIVSTSNPFNPSVGPTTFKYALSKDAEVILYVYNMRAERIWEYRAVAGSTGGQAGINQVLWDGITAYKAVVSSGVCIVHLMVKVDNEYKILSTTKVAVIK